MSPVHRPRTGALEALSREILDTAHDAFVSVDASARIVEWNAAAERMFGWTREEAVGHDGIELLVPERHRSATRARMFARLSEAEAYRGGGRQLRALRRDGSELEVQVSVAPLRTRTALYFNAFVRDVTEQRRAEVHRHELEAVRAVATDAIITLDGAGIVTGYNQAAGRLYRRAAADLIGRPSSELGPALHSEEHRQLIGEVLASGRSWVGRSLQIPRDDGTTFLADLHITPVVDDEGVMGGCAIAVRALSEDHAGGEAAALSEEWRLAVERAALRGDGIQIVFQPIVDLARGVVAGYEALSRFTGPPTAPPDQWFAVASALGLAGALEARAIEAALARRADLPANCFLTVNVSPHALGTPEVQEVLAAAHPLGGVVVEITEQSHVSDYDELGVRLDELRAAGALIAVDDAGAGYASLRHVVAIRPDLVKLDRSLADGVDRDPAKAAAVEMLGGLAGRLDAWLLAEGIEREAELDTLIALGVPLAQGYFLARPDEAFTAPAPELAARLAARARVVSGAVEELMEAVTTVGPSRDGVCALSDGQEFAVVVNAVGQVRAVLHRDGCERPAMVVLPQTTAKDAALRALARPAATRFDPIVVHDELGRVIGAIRFERLVARLAADA